MLAFRSSIALGLAVAWNGASLAQAPDTTGTAPAPTPVSAPFIFYTEAKDGGSAAGGTPAPAGLVEVLTEAVAGGAKQPNLVHDYMIQERAPNAPLKLMSEILGKGDVHTEWPLFFRGIPNEQGLGASFEPADDSLRAQLDVPKNQGLVVTSVAPGGPAAQIGVVANDIVLTLADKPVGTVEDLSKVVKSSGEEPVTLKLLRRGKPLTIQVKPEHHVTLGPVATTRTRYLLGVQIKPLEGALRSHLGLPDDQGLLVTNIEKGTPAERVGLQKNDVLIAIGDKLLTAPDNLVTQVQESRGKPIALKLLRAGKPQTVEVTPDERKETIDVTVTRPDRTVFTAVRPTQSVNYNPLWSVNRHGVVTPPGETAPLNVAVQARSLPADGQIGELLREVRELRKAVDQLQKALKEHESGERKEK